VTCPGCGGVAEGLDCAALVRAFIVEKKPRQMATATAEVIIR